MLKFRFKIPRKKVILLLFLLVTIIAIPLFIYIFFVNRIYPQIYLSYINVSGKTNNQVIYALSQTIIPPQSITLKYDEDTFEIPLSNINFSYDFNTSFQNAFFLYHKPNPLKGFFYMFINLGKPKVLPLVYSYNQEKLDEIISQIENQILIEPIAPSVRLSGKEILIKKGALGRVLDKDDLQKQFNSLLAYANSPEILLKVEIIDNTLSQEEVTLLYNRVKYLTTKNLKIYSDDKENIYQNNNLIRFLNPKNGYNEQEILNEIETLSQEINRPPQNPVFIFENDKVSEFAPAKEGLEIKKEELKAVIINALEKLETESNLTIAIEAPVIKTPSEYETKDVNNLGINALLGKGISRFTGSMTARIYNISLASSKFNGVIVKPEETFSFNSIVGDATKENGYKEAYIIKEGKTELGDGGGVCQVSTTLFRAVLNSGLPVIERRAHSYRVSYYEIGSSPGLDATTFYPTTDFKFKNNTPAHLLIQTKVDTKTKTLTFEIYGTNDGRTVTIGKSIVTDPVPPPEDLYIDDPTLPVDTVKQIDWKAWGAKVSFTYLVKRNEEIIYQKTFKSDYQPWQAKFLRGTGQ